eukprot:scaffold276033_cov15-Tisochrysis_lutea.AAC.1
MRLNRGGGCSGCTADASILKEMLSSTGIPHYVAAFHRCWGVALLWSLVRFLLTQSACRCPKSKFTTPTNATSSPMYTSLSTRQQSSQDKSAPKHACWASILIM